VAFAKAIKCRWKNSVKMLGLALNPKKCRLACPTLVMVFGIGCSPGLDNRQGSDIGAEQEAQLGQNKIRFRNPEMAAKYDAAKAAPRSFDPVYAYAKAVTDACLAPLVDSGCKACAEGAVKYKQSSTLEIDYWPIIGDALSMLEALENVPGLAAQQMDPLVATKGRLLWLSGRSAEEQTLIDAYAHAHPDAVGVVRRRLELLREAGDAAASESQCARSRAKTESASEAARLDLLTACVALHPGNTDGRSDLMGYAEYLPNLSTAEDALYRGNLVQRCVEKVGDEEARCTQACACTDKDSGKQPTAKCKRACGGCHNETAQRLRVCKSIGEAPHATVRASRPKTSPAKDSPRPKSVDPHAAPQRAVP
jgi:hypothetical protein